MGAALFLWVMWRFFRVVAPALAPRAFALYALGGGLGGVLYGATYLAGLHDAASFDEGFLRFALYDLLEGPAVAPFLLAPRLYYTVSLTACFGALTLALGNTRGTARAVLIGLLFFAGAWLNMRVGVFVFAIGALHACLAPNGRIATLAAPAVGCGLGCLAYALVLAANPVFAGNYVAHTDQGLWLTPFLSATCFVTPLALGAVVSHWPSASRIGRQALGAIGGYLAAFVLLFLAHQVYWGNLWTATGESRAAIAVSDWALMGAVAGFFLARRNSRAGLPNADSPLPWIAVWGAGALALALSAFGQGWFLQLTPQRLVVVAAPALALLAAAGLNTLAERAPRAAKGVFGATLSCGIASIVVATLCVQAPVRFRFGESPFADWHHEVIRPQDLPLIDALEGGTVLTTWPMSDIVALHAPAQVLGGVASNDLSDVGTTHLQPEIAAFFNEPLEDSERRAFVETWCVDYIFCTNTWPVRAAVLAEFLRAPWLETVATEDKGIVFRVLRDPAP